MAEKRVSVSSLSSILLNKIKSFRSTFTELGYSQHEFELYFLTHVLEHPVDKNTNTNQCLL